MCKIPHGPVPTTHKQFIASSLKDVTIQQNRWDELTRNFKVMCEQYVPPERDRWVGVGREGSEDQVIWSGLEIWRASWRR